MSNPSYKGPGQPIRSAQGGIAEFLGGLFGGAAPSYKTASTPAPIETPTPTTQAPTTPAPTQPTLMPVCLACPLAGMPAGQSARDTACTATTDEPADTVIPMGPGPITIVIQPRS